MDRFSSEGIEATLRYLRELESYKVRVSQEPFFDSAGPFKGLMIAMFASFASVERAKIRKRTLAGLAKATAQGRVGGRQRVEDDRCDTITELWTPCTVRRECLQRLDILKASLALRVVGFSSENRSRSRTSRGNHRSG